MELLPALKPACYSAMIFSAFDWCLLMMIFNMNLVWMADKAVDSVVLAQLQSCFLWESDNQRFSPFGWPFLCIQHLIED